MEQGVSVAYAHSTANRGVVLAHVFLWILFTGPRLLDWAIHSFRESARWKQTDTHSCAAVIWMVATRPRKVSFEDIRRELDWLDLEATLPQLKRIPGVLFLKGPPPGVGLTQEFRSAMRSDLGLAITAPAE